MPGLSPCRRAAIGALAVWTIGGSALSARDRIEAPRWQWSASRRFVAHGTHSIRNLETLLRIEAFASRLEALTGRPLPASPSSPLSVHFVAGSGAEPGVRYREILSGRRVRQEVWVFDADSTGSRAILDAVSHLLLSRYARAFAPPSAGREQEAQIPAGFAVGVNDFLATDSRRDAYQMSHAAALRGQLADWTILLDWKVSDPPDELGRAACAAMIGWLASFPDSSRRMEEILRLFGTGSGDPGEIGAFWVGADVSPRVANMRWILWALALDSRMPGWVWETDEAVEDIRSRLELPGALLENAGQEAVPDLIVPETLLAHRDAEWAPGAARRMIGSLTRVRPMTLPEELRPVPGLLIRWLSAVAQPEPSRFGAWRGRGQTREALRQEWREIRELLERVRAQAQSRREFLDRVEREQASRSGAEEE